jgi:CubicO group peptidase (beta-lactamase class C family)
MAQKGAERVQQNPANRGPSPISELLQQRVIGEGVAPAAAAGFAVLVQPAPAPAAPAAGFRKPAELTVGGAGSLPGGRTASQTTIFDLASVSKSIVACALARLAARGVLSLSQPLGSLVAEARGTPSEQLPLELFLAHRAGLEAHRPLFAALLAGQLFRRSRALEAAAAARRPDCQGSAPPQGFSPIYSDLGYVLLGRAIEQASGKPLDRVVREEVALPLGLELGSARQLSAAQAGFANAVAPTEVVRARGGVVRGVVHDENAWALSGHGCSGHAGLFGSVSDVLGFGRALLEVLSERSDWLPRQALLPLVEPRPGGTLRAGFDGKSSGASSAGELCGPGTFGHLGFTGTSLWCDPAAGIVTVLLTNRVHPTRDNPRIRAARPIVHDALFLAATELRATKGVLPAAPNP